MSRVGGDRGYAGLAGWVAAGLVGTLFLAVAASLLFGQRPVVVLSGSMEPAFSPGDVLIERSIEPSQVKVGQIVTFHEPGTGRMLTHRVRSVESRGARLVSIHNLRTVTRLMEEIREAITERRFVDFRAAFHEARLRARAALPVEHLG